jgi:hypothetical protein
MPNGDADSTPVERERNVMDVSRRHLLRSVAITAGGAAVLIGMAVPAQAKMSQTAAAYQDTPKDDHSCANCTLFRPPSSCTIVDGTISPTGWCRFYAKKAS